MAIINVTPDSFSDGGMYLDPNAAFKRAEKAISEGADIVDIGGESTRPGSRKVEFNEEIGRVVPVISATARKFDIPISIDTTKASVAKAAIEAGAEIVNDISGLRFEPELAAVAAKAETGLILMHSRGEFEEMHGQPAVEDALEEVTSGLNKSITIAKQFGVKQQHIAVDPGIGFGKTALQNLELLANLDKIASRFPEYPVLVGASRKSFMSKIVGESAAPGRLGGSIAAAVLASLNGARILRVHDVAATVRAVKLIDEAKKLRSETI